MHPAGPPRKSLAKAKSAQLPYAAPVQAPVRVHLPKEFAPSKGPPKNKFESHKKVAQKKVDSQDKIKKRNANDRLQQLEAMLHDLQQQMKSLRAEIKHHD